MTQLILAAIAFMGTHFLLSHPLRQPITGRIGEGPFLGLYSLVALITLGWEIWAYLQVPASPLLWTPGNLMWAIGTVLTFIASVLFVGSLLGNPALPDPTGRERQAPEPRGVFSITRHPMMWGFALWGITHIIVFPMPQNIVLAGSIVALALIGAALQDKKKEALKPELWRAWEAKTSYWPFAAIAAGKTRFTSAGPVALFGGTILWLAATWAHFPLSGWAAGIWYWLG